MLSIPQEICCEITEYLKYLDIVAIYSTCRYLRDSLVYYIIDGSLLRPQAKNYAKFIEFAIFENQWDGAYHDMLTKYVPLDISNDLRVFFMRGGDECTPLDLELMEIGELDRFVEWYEVNTTSLSLQFLLDSYVSHPEFFDIVRDSGNALDIILSKNSISALKLLEDFTPLDVAIDADPDLLCNIYHVDSSAEIFRVLFPRYEHNDLRLIFMTKKNNCEEIFDIIYRAGRIIELNNENIVIAHGLGKLTWLVAHPAVRINLPNNIAYVMPYLIADLYPIYDKIKQKHLRWFIKDAKFNDIIKFYDNVYRYNSDWAIDFVKRVGQYSKQRYLDGLIKHIKTEK